MNTHSLITAKRPSAVVATTIVWVFAIAGMSLTAGNCQEPSRMVVFPEPVGVRCLQKTPAFDLQQPSKQVGTFEPGTGLSVLGYFAGSDTFFVRWQNPRGQTVDSLCPYDLLVGQVVATSYWWEGLSVRTLPQPTQQELAQAQQLLANVTVSTNPGILARLQPQMFSGTSVFADSAEAMALRIGAKQECHAGKLSIYTRSGVSLLGRLADVKIYGDSEKVGEITFLIFAGSGDQWAITEMRNLEQTYLQSLTAILGPSKRAVVGAGRTAENGYRWDIADATVIFCVQTKIYAAVRVWPRSRADGQEKSGQRSPEIMRQELQKNVATRANGDVVIENVPFFPSSREPRQLQLANYEALLRYCGIPVDMNTLSFGTSKSSNPGTAMIDVLGELIQKSGGWVNTGKSISMIEVKRYIDKGFPIIWQPCSAAATVDFRTYLQTCLRQQMRPDEWAAQVRMFEMSANEARSGRAVFYPQSLSSGVRLVIGYNEKTQELAYMDSWRGYAAEKWMCISTAATITPPRGAIRNNIPLVTVLGF